MNSKFLGLSLLLTGWLGLAACSEKEGPGGVPEVGPQVEEQLLLVRVESITENFSTETLGDLDIRGGDRPIHSISPEQTIDRVDVIIIERARSSKIVYKKTFTKWSDTSNRTSAPYIEDNKRGRQASIRLKGEELLPEGSEYLVYAIGYHSGTYNNYEPFKGLEVGDKFLNTEKVTIDNETGQASEIFAGAQSIYVKDGKLVANPKDPEISNLPAVRLRRQVAGLMAYLTKIPAVIEKDGKPHTVMSIRVVTPKRNKTALFGGFRSLYDPHDYNKLKVINGIDPMTEYDTYFDGSTKKDAFMVNEDIMLNLWFPGGPDGKPLDANGDGILDANDDNWQLSPHLAEQGIIQVEKGSVFDSGFWIPTYVSKEDAAAGIPTFQMQLIGEHDCILKSWNIEVRQEEEFAETRTIIAEGEGGIPEVITEKNPATPISFNIARNNLYTMGSKDYGASYGEDEPIDLSKVEILVMDVNPGWKDLQTIFFH